MKCSYKCFPHICYSWAAVDHVEKVQFGQVTSREISHIFSESLPLTRHLRKISVFFPFYLLLPPNMYNT